jgi:predicted acyl esterase
VSEGRRVEERITLSDGVTLAVTLYLPDSEQPQPCILEALPYRKDDVTCSYRPEYVRLRDEHQYAVARLDLRGTGSSGGYASDEYARQEQQDLREVIGWLAAQEWCTGKVGMYGTSWSGFNSIHMAMEQVPELAAIIAIYATDDRYTDDVHYLGGALKWLDLVDYCHYMTPMNALPPVPALFGEGWRDEWERRIEQLEPWLFTWLDHQRRDAYWQHGSLRPGYDSIQIPTMLIAGWADGYRNNSLRTAAALREAGVPHRVLFGPWAHASTSSSRPGPRIDGVVEMVRWWDRWLRGIDDGANGCAVPGATIEYFARQSTSPQPDLADFDGEWRAEVWPSPRVTERTLPVSARPPYAVRPEVGTAAWISCAGHAPYGLPYDQRHDDADSMTWEWDADGLDLLGHPRLRLRLVSSAPVAYVSAKLQDVFPDGTSANVSRTLLNLTRRHGFDGAEPLPVGTPVDVELELDVTSWVFAPGHRLRLALAGSDWPDSAAPPGPHTLEIIGGELVLPEVTGPSPFPAPEFSPGDDAEEIDPTVVWRVERDILRRRTACEVDNVATWDTPYGSETDRYWGRVEVDHRTFEQVASSDVSFTIRWPEATVRSQAWLTVKADAEAYDVEVRLEVAEGDPGSESAENVIANRQWRRRFERDLA